MKLNRSVTDIQADIDAKNAAINDEVNKGQQANHDQINLWRMELTTLQAELATAKAQEEAHGARVEQSRTAALSAIETLTYGGVTLRQLCESDTGYDMAVKMVDMLTTAQAEQSSKLIQGYEEREIQQQRQNESLQKIIEDAKSVNAELVRTFNQASIEKEDAEAKKAAAVQQLEEAQAEIKRLEAKVQEQRDELAVGVRGSINVIDTEQQAAEMAALAEKIKADKTIYDLVPDQAINPKNYTAKLASTGEKITFNWTQKNSFIIITDPNEVEQFRTKYAEKYNVPNLSLDNAPQAEVKPPTTFQQAELGHTAVNNGATELSPVGEQTASQAAEPTVITLESLKAEVDAIKAHIGLVAA
jgi:hypothetical protein